MAKSMQQKRRIGAVGAPAGTGAGGLLVGELAYHQTAAAGGAPGDLYIGDGAVAQLLVGPTKVWTTANFKLGGGSSGNILVTDGAGNVSWTGAPSGGLLTVSVASPLTGDGTSGNAITLGTVPVTLGGTNATTAAGALDSLSGASGATAGHLSRAAGGAWSVDTATYLTTVNASSPLTGNGTSGSALTLGTVPINLGGTNGTTALVALDNLTGGSATVTGVPHRTATAWVVGPVPITDGGTGATSAAGSLDALSGASGATTGHLSRSGTGVWSVDTATYLATVSVSAPITGNGAGTALGLTIASAGDVTGGTDNTNPVSSLRLREVTGALTALDAGITNTNLVAAINSVHGQVAALSNPLRFAGTFNAATNVVEAGGLHPAGAVQAPSATNEGWVLIVGTAGTPAAGPAPTVPLTVGDWLISTGAGGTWTLIDLDLHAVAASNVSVTGIAGVTDVQTGLTQIFTATGGNISVLTDGTSIIGTGRTGAALEVGAVDAGTY